MLGRNTSGLMCDGRTGGRAGGPGVMLGVVGLPRLKPRLGYLSVNRRLLRIALATVGRFSDSRFGRAASLLVVTGA